MNFSNSYARLNEVFYERTRPGPVSAPRLFLWNSGLAERLMIPDEWAHDPDSLARIFSGNRILPGSEPIATAYAGHQFGGFAPQLGDGRAHLLGEVLDESGKRWDIQLKGSGRTSFSRGGDGRCALGPALREFIMSEAMAALGVPTTRCLAVVATGETVFRETPLPGAVVTRVASSHIRVGTFQFFAARDDRPSLKTLCRYAMERHYPESLEEGPTPYVSLIDRFMDRQIRLVVEWMRVGFIHGVMNTDNTSISGETIDYGPCAMMGVYDPKTVYSSIDTQGRYAFGNQPQIMQWNITRFAESLLPLINADIHKAVDEVEPVIAEFSGRFEKKYMEMMGKKLGLTALKPGDQDLIESVLNRLRDRRLDYTITFDLLTRSLASKAAASQMGRELGEVFDLWKKRLSGQTATFEEARERMRRHNPVVIPRNHHVEKTLQDCQKTGTAESAERFLEVLRSPYEKLADTSDFQDPPDDGDKGYQTFCGT
ncbi:conserved hypothetical protein [Candidatus Desulfarcum epimagneticum]|uniref:Protein nucleotidyltransferase YdiU n=1 Tax=uncultured Desulfobacteraceae bacterium TaxID=218296 RepID=A0A484HG12_9BACT|nr:conserved hypothetical protein [uncultured Desulfobacteraceae bacterium]